MKTTIIPLVTRDNRLYPNKTTNKPPWFDQKITRLPLGHLMLKLKEINEVSLMIIIYKHAVLRIN